MTIKAPAELTYSGEGKPATVTASSDWQGPAASEITISYIKTGKYCPENLENDALPSNAGEYTASITVGEGNMAATASVKYTIQKANPVVTEWPTLSASVYVNSEATLTGGSGKGTFAFKADAAKSWDSAGSKTTTIVYTPTYTNNYKKQTQNMETARASALDHPCDELQVDDMAEQSSVLWLARKPPAPCLGKQLHIHPHVLCSLQAKVPFPPNEAYPQV